MLEHLRETGAWGRVHPVRTCCDCQQSDVAKLARRMATVQACTTNRRPHASAENSVSKSCVFGATHAHSSVAMDTGTELAAVSPVEGGGAVAPEASASSNSTLVATDSSAGAVVEAGAGASAGAAPAAASPLQPSGVTLRHRRLLLPRRTAGRVCCASLLLLVLLVAALLVATSWIVVGVHEAAHHGQGPPSRATACFPGRLGCSTYSGRAPLPLRSQWQLMVWPSAGAKPPMPLPSTT